MARPSHGTEDRSVRLLKVGERVRHVLSELLTRQQVHDDILTGHHISVTEVRMSPDLRQARVYVKPLLGGDEEEVLAALRRNSARSPSGSVSSLRQSCDSMPTRASTRPRGSSGCSTIPRSRVISPILPRTGAETERLYREPNALPI